MKFTVLTLCAGLQLVSALPNPQLGLTIPKTKPPPEALEGSKTGLVPVKATMDETMNELNKHGGGSKLSPKLDAGLRPIIRNELVDGTTCGKAIFIFARASGEVGNMGASMGPWVCAGLKQKYGKKAIQCQGVGTGSNGEGGYTAGLASNMATGGTDAAALTLAKKMFTTADTKCPKTPILFGGYSQGTAVMHGTVGKLSEPLKAKVLGGVLFGDTRNAQDGGKVPGYPKENVRIFCDSTPADGVCKKGLAGIPNVTNGHFVYTMDGSGDVAVKFLSQKLDAWSAKNGGGAAADEE